MDYLTLDNEYISNTYKRQHLLIVKGKNSVAFDKDGNKYIDFTSGIGVNSLGYANKDLCKIITNQYKLVQHTSNLFLSKPSIELAKKLCEVTGFKKVFFANSGAEANECAFKLARKYQQDKSNLEKIKILALKNSFHGRTIATLTLTGQDVFHNGFGPLMENVEYFDKDSDLSSFKNVAAIFIELIQGEGGVIEIDKTLLKKIEKYCHDNDVILIVDEVQTGVGRSGEFLCSDYFNVKPDIVTLAKGLGGGLPIGACLMGDKVKDTFTYSSHGSTFGGNPVVTAGRLYVVDTVSKKEFLEEVKKKGDLIKSKLSNVKQVKKITGVGLMIGIELNEINASDIYQLALKKGLLVLTAKNNVRLLPPLNITYKELEKGLTILIDTIKELGK